MIFKECCLCLRLEFLHGFINLFALTENSLCNMLSILLALLSTLPGSLWWQGFRNRILRVDLSIENCRQTETDVSKMVQENLTPYTRNCYHPERFSMASGSLSIYFCDKLTEFADLLKVDYSKVFFLHKLSWFFKIGCLHTIVGPKWKSVAKFKTENRHRQNSSSTCQSTFQLGAWKGLDKSDPLHVIGNLPLCCLYVQSGIDWPYFQENFANCHQNNLLMSHILFTVYFALTATVVDDRNSSSTSVIAAHVICS